MYEASVNIDGIGLMGLYRFKPVDQFPNEEKKQWHERIREQIKNHYETVFGYNGTKITSVVYTEAGWHKNIL